MRVGSSSEWGLAILLLLIAVACGSDEDGGESATSGGASSSGGAGAGATGGGSTAGSGGSAAGSPGAGGATASSGGSAGPGGVGGGPSGVWSMGYYASWQANDYPVSAIEWSGLTHVAMAFYMPDSDGSLELLGGNPGVAAALVDAAHANGVLAVASIGGADSANAFRSASAAGTLDAFVANLVDLLDDPGYDGIDIDWEPLEVSDEATAIELATRLRTARANVLLTIPVGYVNPNVPADVSGYAAIADAYDQLNIMSYGMAGAWQGWNSWHSSAIYQTNAATPLSIDSTVNIYVDAGVPVSKLGLGIGGYGLCYSEPVTGPDQPLGGATILASDGTMSYANIMTRYYDESARHWDSLARVPYLSFESPQAPDGCTYISYDDAESIAEKAAYLESRGLGGVILWQINEAYLPGQAAGRRSPLLSALHDSLIE